MVYLKLVAFAWWLGSCYQNNYPNTIYKLGTCILVCILMYSPGILCAPVCSWMSHWLINVVCYQVPPGIRYFQY